jgi:hypothetical protein
MHARKTAGSSITAYLNRFIGPNDIQVGAWPDTIKYGGKYNEATIKSCRSNFRNTFESIGKRIGVSSDFEMDPQTVNKLSKRYYRRKYGLLKDAHSTARQVQNAFQKEWDDYFKFCVVRNPWTHAVSDYYWRLKGQGNPDVTFREFVMRLEDPKRPDPERLRPPLITNWDIYTIDDRIALDHVARYEDLNDEMDAVGRQIGLPIDLSTIDAKGKVRDRRKPVAEHYDQELTNLVGRIYEKEATAFGYEPPF